MTRTAECQHGDNAKCSKCEYPIGRYGEPIALTVEAREAGDLTMMMRESVGDFRIDDDTDRDSDPVTGEIAVGVDGQVWIDFHDGPETRRFAMPLKEIVEGLYEAVIR